MNLRIIEIINGVQHGILQLLNDLNKHETTLNLIAVILNKADKLHKGHGIKNIQLKLMDYAYSDLLVFLCIAGMMQYYVLGLSIRNMYIKESLIDVPCSYTLNILYIE